MCLRIIKYFSKIDINKDSVLRLCPKHQVNSKNKPSEEQKILFFTYAIKALLRHLRRRCKTKLHTDLQVLDGAVYIISFL